MEVSAGVFWCAADGDRWEQREKGPYDSQLPDTKPDGSTASVKFSMKGRNYDGKVYIPLPSESAFTDWLGFERKNESWKEKDNFSLKYQEGGTGGLQDMQIDRMVCRYDKAKDGYTIIIFERNGNDWISRAQYFCKSDGDKWTRQ